MHQPLQATKLSPTSLSEEIAAFDSSINIETLFDAEVPDDIEDDHITEIEDKIGSSFFEVGATTGEMEITSIVAEDNSLKFGIKNVTTDATADVWVDLVSREVVKATKNGAQVFPVFDNLKVISVDEHPSIEQIAGPDRTVFTKEIAERLTAKIANVKTVHISTTESYEPEAIAKFTQLKYIKERGQPFKLVETFETGSVSKRTASEHQQDLEFSRNGELLAACFGNRLVLLSSPKKTEGVSSLTQFSVITGGIEMSCNFSSDDGSLLAFDGNRLWKWHCKSRKLEQPIEMDFKGMCNATWSPNGKSIAVGQRSRIYDNAVVSVVDIASGVRSKLGEVHGWGSTTTIGFDDVQYLPGGNRLATDSNLYDDDQGNEYRIHLWDVKNKKLLKQVIGKNSCCSPDGKLLAFEGWPNDKISRTVSQVRFLDTETFEVRQPLPGKSLKSPAAWSPDGKLLAILRRDNGVAVWDVKQRKVVDNLEAQKTKILAAAFSPDGLRIAASCTDGTIRIWGKNKFHAKENK